MQTDYTTIGLIEDNQLMRMCIEEFVNFRQDLSLLFSCNSIESWLSHYDTDQTNPSFLLLDLGLPGIGGFDAILLLKGRYPLSQLLIISGESSGEKVWRAIVCGAIGYLPKPFSPKELLQQISFLKMGNTGLLPNSNNKLDYGLTGLHKHPPENLSLVLTKKENQILEALLGGLDITGIGNQLGLTLQEAGELAGNIFEKAASEYRPVLINRVLQSRQSAVQKRQNQ